MSRGRRHIKRLLKTATPERISRKKIKSFDKENKYGKLVVFHLRVRDKWGVGDSVGGNGLISLGPRQS